MNNTGFLTSLTEAQLGAFFGEAEQILNQAEASQRERERIEATRFNLLRMIDPDENGLSDILADLLRPNGRHGQGDCFLRLFLDQLEPDLGKSLKSVRRVKREARAVNIQESRRRLDIVIETVMQEASPVDRLIVGIENKIDAVDQPQQVQHYLDHLQLHNARDFLIYLTPNGREPESLAVPTDRLYCWSYAVQVKNWLKSCIEVCQADKVRHFLVDFIEYIDVDLWRRQVAQESEAPK